MNAPVPVPATGVPVLSALPVGRGKRRPAPEPFLRAVSLGAGVQSTTLVLMAAKGLIGPMPDVAIFADTGWEPKAVHAHLAWLETQLPFPVVKVSKGNIRDDIVAGGGEDTKGFINVPFHTKNPDGSKGMGRRQCTTHYKLTPIYREVRRILTEKGIKSPPPASVDMWVGISLDEVFRRREAPIQYVKNRWPLLELGMTRAMCLSWLAENGYPQAPKSSCIGCPFKSDAQWLDLKNGDPSEWQDAIEIDRLIRHNGKGAPRGVQQFLHASLKPLEEIDLQAKQQKPQLDLFLNECLGMCGT